MPEIPSLFDLIVIAVSAFLRLILGGIVELLPAPPDEAVMVWGYLGDVWDLLQSFSTWVPVEFASTMVGLVIICYGVHLSIGVARTIVSYFTLGGGAS